MKVSELIKKLKTLPEDYPVLLGGYEGGHYVPNLVLVETLLRDVNKEWYYGPHEVFNEFTREQFPQASTFRGVIIR